MNEKPSIPGRITVRTAGLAFIALAVMVQGFVVAPSAHAFDLKPDEIRGKSSKTPVTVLQNRYFLKAYRPEVGFIVGTVLDEAYLKTSTMGARVGMFFNEWLGMEVQMQRTNVSDSEDRKALNRLKYRPLEEDTSGDAVPDGEEVTVSPDPEVNPIYGMTDINAVAAPFYGKLNVVDSLIIYTDVYLSGGVAQVDTEQGPKTALTLGAGERFYVGKAWSLRVDFKDRIFEETRADEPVRKHSMSFDFGASYFFN